MTANARAAQLRQRLAIRPKRFEAPISSRFVVALAGVALEHHCRKCEIAFRAQTIDRESRFVEIGDEQTAHREGMNFIKWTLFLYI